MKCTLRLCGEVECPDSGQTCATVCVSPVCHVISIKMTTRDGRFGSKVGQIGPKWDKSGAFSDQIFAHLAPLQKGADWPQM